VSFTAAPRAIAEAEIFTVGGDVDIAAEARRVVA